MPSGHYITCLAAFMLSLAVASAEELKYVRHGVCGECHSEQVAYWHGSQHDLAMQDATGETVLGDFDNAEFTAFGTASYFFKANGRYFVRIPGVAGKPGTFQVKYTFGVEPIQQYIVELPGGRMQMLGLAWDARPANQGGQHWFNLFPGDAITSDDELYWTRPSQNWNSMCAECHSTGLQKNYDPVKKTYSTTWSEIDVSCEACHGPGERHVVWARQSANARKQDASKGLAVVLRERAGVSWTIEPTTGSAVRSETRETSIEIEVCARCHARRTPITSQDVHGEPFMDHYQPQLLAAGLYHDDGQIDDEVYVYGSFLQSKMFDYGVTCSDCHNPHDLTMRKPGNKLCLQCHVAGKYDQTSHHFHKPEAAGGSCISCHMPSKVYMMVDSRHDHSIRIPRPDLSVRLGVPNACTNCHTEKSDVWAAEHFHNWYGMIPTGYQQYAEAFAAARREEGGAGSALVDVIQDPSTPEIARASALARLGPYLTPDMTSIIARYLSWEDSAVRTAALRLLEFLPVSARIMLAVPRLSDPIRAVRIEAARLLSPLDIGGLSVDEQLQLKAVQAEYLSSLQTIADYPEAQVNLGNLYRARNEQQLAVDAYITAIEINPEYVPAYINLSDMYRSLGDESGAERILRQSLGVIPKNGDIHHALGLSLIRQKRLKQAVGEFAKAAKQSPDNAHYLYVYAVALDSIGNRTEAITVLQDAHDRFPWNKEITAAQESLQKPDDSKR